MTLSKSRDTVTSMSRPVITKRLMQAALRTVWWPVVLVLSVVSLTACGGGSDSGGGGGAQFAGTYNGMATVTLTTPGVAPQTITGTIQFRIGPDGTVTSDPNTDFSGTGTLNGNTFVVNLGPQQLTPEGMSCVGSVTLSGKVDGNTITGTFSSAGFSCNGVPFTWNGTFSAMRTPGAAVTVVGDPAIDALRDAVRATQ